MQVHTQERERENGYKQSSFYNKNKKSLKINASLKGYEKQDITYTCNFFFCNYAFIRLCMHKGIRSDYAIVSISNQKRQNSLSSSFIIHKLGQSTSLQSAIDAV